MVTAEAERLFVRFHAARLDAMAEVFGDLEVMRFGPARSRETGSRDGCVGVRRITYHKWAGGLWAVVHKSDGRVIGFCRLTRFDDVDGRPEIEIGYRLARAFWGCGLATEAAGAARDYAFCVLVLPRLVSIIDPLNVASVRVVTVVSDFFHEVARTY